MDKDRLEKLLMDALNMEEKGYDFYMDTAKKSKNEITKKTFTFLAEQEKLHIENIKNFYNEQKEKGRLPKLDLSAPAEKRGRDVRIFSKSIKELSDKITPSDDDKKACEFAMEFEDNGYKYYREMEKNADDENLLVFLRFLMAEETDHRELISNLYTYITDSQNWFMYEEGSFPQGG